MRVTPSALEFDPPQTSPSLSRKTQILPTFGQEERGLFLGSGFQL